MSLEPPSEPPVDECDPEIELKAFLLYERKVREWGWDNVEQYEQEEEMKYDSAYWEREFAEEEWWHRFVEACDSARES